MELTLQQWQFAKDASGVKAEFPTAIRIENTLLSVARLSGGAKINGETYLYVNPLDTESGRRADLVVHERLAEWAERNMGADRCERKARRIDLHALQGELFR